MTVTNHMVHPRYDIQLAMIEGTEIAAMCGERFIPTVTPGTSGRASVPGAPDCKPCDDLTNLSIEWNELRKERNRINREMNAKAKAFRTLAKQTATEREKVHA